MCLKMPAEVVFIVPFFTMVQLSIVMHRLRSQADQNPGVKLTFNCLKKDKNVSCWQPQIDFRAPEDPLYTPSFLVLIRVT